MRQDGRRPHELRPLTIEPDFLENAHGSALISFGKTRVLCTASVEEGVPRWLAGSGLRDSVAAVSVGIVDGEPAVDLDYAEDSTAEVDMNVVMSGEGKLVEVQATAERAP